MATNPEGKPKKKTPYKVLLPVLYALLALVGAFNICILSYAGCEIVPWLLTRDSTVAEAQVSTPPAATQPPATQLPATPPPSAAPVAETEAPSDAPDDATEPPASEPPVETPAATDPPAAETATPKPTTAPVTETKAPQPTKAPEPSKTPATSGSSSSYQEEYGTIYVTKTGKRYHYDSTCNGGTYIPSTYEEAMRRNLTPCQKCVLE